MILFGEVTVVWNGKLFLIADTPRVAVVFRPSTPR